MTGSNSPLLSDTVTAVTIGAEKGLVWIGTNAGIMQYQNSSFQSYTADQSPLGDNLITSICESSDSVTWFGTLNGVGRFTPTNWNNFTEDNSGFLYSDRITAMASRGLG